MTWYTGITGNWSRPEGVRRIEGSFSRKEIVERAQKVANELNQTVTIIAEKGMKTWHFEVNPMK